MCVTTKSKLKCPCDFSLLQRIETTHGVMFYAEEFDRDEWVWSESSLCHNASSHGLLAEGEGERVCCCSDLVLRLHMGHVFCISVADGHHPVSYPDTSLSCLAARGQLEKRKRPHKSAPEEQSKITLMGQIQNSTIVPYLYPSYSLLFWGRRGYVIIFGSSSLNKNIFRVIHHGLTSLHTMTSFHRKILEIQTRPVDFPVMLANDTQ